MFLQSIFLVVMITAFGMLAGTLTMTTEARCVLIDCR